MKFNWLTFLFEALNFVVLAYVLHRLLYRPLRAAIDQRRQENLRVQAEAEKARQEAAALEQRLRDQLAQTELQRQDVIRQARQQAQVERQKLLSEGERAAQRRQQEVHQALERDRQEALQSVRQEVITQAIQLCDRLLGEAADRTLHQQLAQRLVRTLEQLPQEERKHLRTGWHFADTAVLECAHELDSPTFEQLTNAVSGIVGQPVAVMVHVRPELLGGARLRLAGQVWDGSLAGQLTDLRNGKDGRA